MTYIKKGNWGLFEWGPYILDLIFDSTTQDIGHSCSCLLKDHYFRLDPVLIEDVGLDQISSIPKLKKVAEGVDLQKTKEWLEKYWFTSQPSTFIPHLSNNVSPKQCSIQ